MHLAAAQKNSELPIRHLILSAPFTTLPAMAHEMLPMLKVVPRSVIGLLTSRQAWDNVAAGDRLALSNTAFPRIDIAHGSVDAVVPHAMGLELSKHLRLLGLPVTFRSVDGFDHNDLFSSQEYQSWLQDAFAKGGSVEGNE